MRGKRIFLIGVLLGFVILAGGCAGGPQHSLGGTLQFAAGQSYAPYCEKVVDASFTTLPNGPRVSAPASGGCLMPGL